MRGNRKQRLKVNLCLGAIFSSLLLFQNCHYSGFNSQFLTSNKAIINFGNGGGYEGKPDGEYYRFIPGYTCEGQSTYKEYVEIRGSEALIYKNQVNQCSSAPQPFSISAVEFSPFQSEFVTVENYLYKKYENRPAETPQVLAEALCRDDFLNPAIEIITHFDQLNQRALARVYTKNEFHSDFAIKRLLSPEKIEYAGDNIRFQIDLTEAGGATAKKASGKIESSSIPGVSKGNLVCVTGGGIDTSYWPLRHLIDIPVLTWMVQAQTGDVYFSGYPQEKLAQTHLYRLRKGESYENLIDKLPFYDLDSITSQANSPYIRLNGNILGYSGWRSQYLWDPSRPDSLRRLTNLLDLPAQFVEWDRGTTYMGSGLLSSDLHLQNISKPSLSTHSLRILSLDSGEFTDYFTTKLPHRGLASHPQSGQVFAFMEDFSGNPTLKVLDVFSRHIGSVPLPATSCPWNPGWLKLVHQDSKLLLLTDCKTGHEDFYTISVANFAAQARATAVRFLKNLAGSPWIWMEDTASTFVFNAETGQQVKTSFIAQLPRNNLTVYGPPDFGPYLLAGSQQKLVGLGGDASLALYLNDLSIGIERRICLNSSGQILTLKSLPSGDIYLLTYNNIQTSYDFYKVTDADHCSLVNSLPTEKTGAVKMEVSKLGFLMALDDTSPEWEGKITKPQDIIFVPLNGRPAFRLNPDYREIVRIMGVQTSPDLSKIYISGYPRLDDGFRAEIFVFEAK